MYHRPDSAVRAARRAVCVGPRGRVGARTGSPRSRAILLSTLARYITDRVTLWSERPKRKLYTHMINHKYRSPGSYSDSRRWGRKRKEGQGQASWVPEACDSFISKLLCECRAEWGGPVNMASGHRYFKISGCVWALPAPPQAR